jgi:hypothetical protein
MSKFSHQELIEKFIKNPSYLDNGAGKLSISWGVTKEEIKEAKAAARRLMNHPQFSLQSFSLKTLVEDLEASTPSTEKTPKLSESRVDIESGETKHTLLFDRPLTKEELEEHFHIDNVNLKITNYWSILVKSGEGYATSVNIKNISKDFNIDKANDIVKNFVEKKYTPTVVENDGENLLLLNIADFHLDKEDIGENDIVKKTEKYISCIKTLLERASVHKIDRILYVVGNDYFNTDNIFNSTTKGTPQNVTLSWEKSYEIGFELQVYIFRLLELYCPNIDILHVSGNHDETKSYYLAYSLSRYFEKSNINFLINSEPRKQYSYGNTFFGFHHGNTAIDKLPLNFSKQFNEEWGKCEYHEIITADKHHYKQYEKEGVRIHQMPSLSGTDNWHNNNNFNNSIQSALGLMYNASSGKFAEFEVRI